jgi:hypothetical protein
MHVTHCNMPIVIEYIASNIWPSKHSDVVAIHHCHNKVPFEGHTHPQQPQKIHPQAWGVATHPFEASAQSARPHVGR